MLYCENEAAIRQIKQPRVPLLADNKRSQSLRLFFTFLSLDNF
jgi:hypothetical protein